MAATKKRVVRPNLGGTLRPQAESPRHHFLFADVTKSEYEQIQQYCVEHQISISQFLADLVLQDADKPKSKRRRKVILRPEIELTSEEQDKLELLARLNQKKSVGEFIRDLLQPNLKLQRLRTPLEITSLRFYLSEEEHEKVLNHVAQTGISARNYGAMLALRAIRKAQKKHKKRV